MRGSANGAIVIDRSSSIDDRKITNHRAGVDHGPSHDDNTVSHLGAW
jgi:hypothetical protein